MASNFQTWTRKSRPSLLTTAPACARPASLETMLLAPCSRPSWVAPDTRYRSLEEPSHELLELLLCERRAEASQAAAFGS